MNIGSLRHKVQIQTRISDETFDTPVQWKTIRNTWASIKALTEKETYQVGQLSMKVQSKIIIRYPGKTFFVKAGDRVVYKNRVFELQTGLTNPDERNITLELFVFEIDPIQ